MCVRLPQVVQSYAVDNEGVAVSCRKGGESTADLSAPNPHPNPNPTPTPTPNPTPTSNPIPNPSPSPDPNPSPEPNPNKLRLRLGPGLAMSRCLGDLFDENAGVICTPTVSSKW